MVSKKRDEETVLLGLTMQEGPEGTLIGSIIKMS